MWLLICGQAAVNDRARGQWQWDMLHSTRPISVEATAVSLHRETDAVYTVCCWRGGTECRHKENAVVSGELHLLSHV